MKIEQLNMGEGKTMCIVPMLVLFWRHFEVLGSWKEKSPGEKKLIFKPISFDGRSQQESAEAITKPAAGKLQLIYEDSSEDLKTWEEALHSFEELSYLKESFPPARLGPRLPGGGFLVYRELGQVSPPSQRASSEPAPVLSRVTVLAPLLRENYVKQAGGKRLFRTHPPQFHGRVCAKALPSFAHTRS